MSRLSAPVSIWSWAPLLHRPSQLPRVKHASGAAAADVREAAALKGWITIIAVNRGLRAASTVHLAGPLCFRGDVHLAVGLPRHVLLFADQEVAGVGTPYLATSEGLELGL